MKVIITKAGLDAGFHTDVLTALDRHVRDIPSDTPMPAWMARADDYTPTDGGASACVEHVQ